MTDHQHTKDHEHPIENPTHALLVGAVHGQLLKHSVDTVAEVDADGNYLASLIMTLEPPYEDVRVRLVVEQMTWVP